MKKNYPDYWAMMMKWDDDSPVVFRTDGTTIHDLNERFEAGFVFKREYNKFLMEKERKIKVNKNLFVSKMKLHGDNQTELAAGIGISVQRLNAKINETNGAEFTQSEMRKIKDRYSLTNDEVDEIFFK